MSLFNFSQEEILTFFAVLVRFSVLISILPFVGDRFVPNPVKILLALIVSFTMFPALVSTGKIHPGESIAWAATTGGIVATISYEVLVALVLGFTARFSFEAINFGANLAGSFMGFASASNYDPHQESQTQIVAEIQMAMAMLLFLALDGHHLMLRAALESYNLIGVGGLGHLKGAGFNGEFSRKLLELSGQVIKYGVQLAAPVAVSLFSVNVVFGVMAKAMPQLNVLVLSFAVSALIGLFVMLISIPEFQGLARGILENMSASMESVLIAMKKGG